MQCLLGGNDGEREQLARNEGGKSGKCGHMWSGCGALDARYLGGDGVVRALGGDAPLFVAGCCGLFQCATKRNHTHQKVDYELHAHLDTFISMYTSGSMWHISSQTSAGGTNPHNIKLGPTG